MSDVWDNTLIRTSIAPAVRTNGTVNGNAIDLALGGGAEGAVVAVSAGTITDGTQTVTVEESDTGTSGWTAVPAGRIQGALPGALGPGGSNTTAEFGVVPSKRFLRAVLTVAGATSGGAVSVVIALGDLRFKQTPRP